MNAMCRFFAVLVCLFSTAACFSESGVDPQGAREEHIRKARGFLDEKRPNLAIPELQAAVAIDPSNAETQGNLGVFLYFQGGVADAIPHLRAAVERQPGLGV